MFHSPPGSKAAVVTVSCGQCKNVDTDDMVQCDKCDTWYHFQCVGVTGSVANHQWKCFQCTDKAEGDAKITDGQHISKKPISIKSSNFSKRRQTELDLKRLEEEKALEMRYIKKKFAILASEKDPTEERNDGDEASERSLRTRQWVRAQRNQETGSVERLANALPLVGVHPHVVESLTRSQIAARQALSKDLPTFSGKPEEWPIFYSAFMESTGLCNFSDAENLLRLQKSLKGKAYDTVSSQLLLPKNISEVIRTLRMMFGRPEIILNSLLEKIRAQAPPKSEKLESLVFYAISVRNLCTTLEASGLTKHLNNPLLLQELVDKLPAQTKLNWALHIGDKDADISCFSKWLFSIAEAVTRVSTQFNTNKTCANLNAHDVERSSATANKCNLCHAVHFLDSCEKFIAMKLSERWDIIKKFKFCRLCRKKHGSFRCSDAKCPVQGCKARHHKLLHRFVQQAPTVTAHSSLDCTTNVLFKILPVVLYHEGRSMEVFAFLDDGSNVTLLQKDVCDYLGLRGELNTLCLKWTSDSSREEENSMTVNLMISSQMPNAKKFDLFNVHTVKNLSLPVQSVKAESIKAFRHLRSLPITYYTNAKPKILIGLNNAFICNTLKTVEGGVNQPCASKTRLGWTIHGGCNGTQEAVHNFHKCDCNDNFEKLHMLVSDYLSLETTVKSYELKSAEDQRATDLLESTTKRIGNRFETGLLWREDNAEIPDSYPMAKKRLQCLERQLKPEQIALVTHQIDCLVEKGYARKLTMEEDNESDGVKWYLPIFTVLNANKPGKVRLVWDAAAKVRGYSLNSMLLKGPDLTTPLLSVLYGFRMKKIALCADIKEMFHQMRIRKQDQNAQRFIWRNNEKGKEPDVYVMEVMTFGAACSPCSAQFVKNKNASEFQKHFPRAVDSILYHHYVDDLLDCADSESEAKKLAQEVAFIHNQGGFFIRNWRSNSTAVLKALANLEEKSSNELLSLNKEMPTEKVLGMWWATDSDVFTFSLKLSRIDKELLNGEKIPTKTDVLRTLMSLYDPLGFLSPYVVALKIILQEVWRTTEGWNDLVNEDIFKRWISWMKLLPQVENIRIPRWYHLSASSSVQLHVFVDASELAYAAVAYFRIGLDNEYVCRLVGSKVKVAPKQPLSIPRMELMAAVLGVRLATTIGYMHKLQFEQRWFWSDSNTVLSWLNSDPRNFKQFVMFRVGEIQESSRGKEWRYIPTKQNVADDATKWKGAAVFDSENRWFQAPEFLKQPEASWPQKEKLVKSDIELKPHLVMFHAGEFLDDTLINYRAFSSWNKLQKTVSAVFAFCDRLKRGTLTRSILLSKANNYLFRLIQEDSFKDEIISLRKGKNIEKSSQLYKCSPYLDENSVIRMCGRIDSSNVPTDTKRPIILPRNHHCSHLLISHYHEQFHHVHHDTCLNELRKKFFIPRLRTEHRKVRRNCQHCKNASCTPVVPEMAQLPNARISAYTRPFSYVGIDYFGPIFVKVARHQEKRWGVLFTCLTIRAIHIEVAQDLTTDTCIMAIQNFIARRGTPIAIYCDNGTNFRGSEAELRKAAKEIDQKQLEIKFSTPLTTWNFNPPGSPHMGGSWERLIRSIKIVLYKISPQFSFKDNTLNNALLECERIINSRPLTYVEVESPYEEALTPNHFLLGSLNGEKPLGVFNQDDCILKKNWRKTQYFADLFWKRWVQEYLPTLTKRTKWFTKEKKLAVDDIVIIVDSNLPRNNWPLGVVQSVNIAKDGNVRSATIRTKNGVFTRPVAKIAKLDVRSSTA